MSAQKEGELKPRREKETTPWGEPRPPEDQIRPKVARCRKILEDARGSLAVRSAGNSRIEDGTRAAVSTADFSTARVEVLAEVASTAGTLAAAADGPMLVEDAVTAKICSRRGGTIIGGLGHSRDAIVAFRVCA